MTGGFKNGLFAGASALAMLLATGNAAVAGDDALNLKIDWKGGPEFSTNDGQFKFKVRGRIQTDGTWGSQDKSITGSPNVNATEIRRAMLGVQGTMLGKWDYIFETLFYDSTAEISDAYLTYTGFPVHVTIGQFKTFNSLEQLTSSNVTTFMERAAFTKAFDLQRQVGLGLTIKNDTWTLGAGVYGANVKDVAFDEGATFAARGTFAPINTKTHVLHFGAHVRHRDSGDLREYRYAQRAADLHLMDTFVDTGYIGTSDTMWGLEFAAVAGAFSVQGEYSQDRVRMPQHLGGFGPRYEGWYVDASWFLTGEHRNYSKGTFSRVKVIDPVSKGGPGAWQIAGRYDVVDLSDKAGEIASFGAVSCVECGDQKTWLFGVNWYPVDNVRFMLNVAHSKIDGGKNDGAEITAAGVRAQIDW